MTLHAASSHPLSHVRTWLFDLDNTLYPAAVDLFAQIDKRMESFIADLLACDRTQARRVQKDYFINHGTTLRGLMDAHGVDPHDFLSYVHDIDFSVLEEDRRLIEGMGRLPGRKLVFTNGDAAYARRVLERLGLTEAFEAIHDIHATGYLPKPDPRAYAGLCEAYAIDPTTALFAEDMARNLKPAKAIGMTTLWVNNGSERGDHEACPSYIDYEVRDLGAWIEGVTAELGVGA